MRVAILLAFLAFIALTCVSAHTHHSMKEKFAQWMTTHSKTYGSTQEQSDRFAIFSENMKQNEINNIVNGSPIFGMNKFSDLSAAEFRATHLNSAVLPKESPVMKVLKPSVVPSTPTPIDWRTKGALTPVKDQGQCGSCWAFSTTETVESQLFLTGKTKLQALAPQQIVSCDLKEDGGCNGGWPMWAYNDYLKTTGLELESSYPYTSGTSGQTGACSFNASAVVTPKLANWAYATPNCNDTCTKQDEATLAANLVESGPISICLDATAFQSYTSGILADPSLCSQAYTSIDHCVQLVGLGVDGADTFWIVRNSWASSWGEAGFIRMKYGINLCGIADTPTIPSF